MNIGYITQPNTKGQIVIPYKMRKSLGITQDTPLQLTQAGDAVIIRPIQSVVTGHDGHQSVLALLKKTAGSWAGDDWPAREKKQRVIELAASQKMKDTTW